MCEQLGERCEAGMWPASSARRFQSALHLCDGSLRLPQGNTAELSRRTNAVF